MDAKKIKVCHLTSAHPDGDVRIFHKECVSLAKFGFDVSLIVPNTESRVEKRVKIISFKSDYITRRERMTKTVKQVFSKAMEVDADVYHFHDPELLRVALKLKRVNKKVIYDVHEDLPKQIRGKYWINKNLRIIISFSFKIYENYMAKKMSGIITATPYIANRFKQINKNTITINNFPFINELNISSDSNTISENYICYVGGITKIRGINELVESMALVSNTKLLLAGPVSPNNYLKELQTIKGWDRVEYLGKVDRKGVANILNKSFAGLVTFYPLPNHVDAQPNKMFEYMSAGIPIIGSHFPLWKEIILGNNCGVCVDPEDSKEIAQAIISLQKEPKVVENMGNNGRNAVINKYNWNIEEAKLISFYNELIND